MMQRHGLEVCSGMLFSDRVLVYIMRKAKTLGYVLSGCCFLTLIRMTKDEKGLAFFKGLLL
jgi:hypothetical protein